MKKLSAGLALILSLVLLSGCGALTLYEENGRLVDRKNGVGYTSAPICFEPIKVEEEPYAKLSGSKLELYAIEGVEPKLWISEPYDGIGGVWYNDSELTLPTLPEFNSDIIYVCVEQNITIALGQIDDKSAIDSIVGAFTDGESVMPVNSGTSYKLKFASDDYPGLYYNLLYIEADDGDNYIYDRSTQTCVNVGDVLLEYMPR